MHFVKERTAGFPGKKPPFVCTFASNAAGTEGFFPITIEDSTFYNVLGAKEVYSNTLKRK